MGWLLVLAALGFGVHKTNSPTLITLLVISIVALWVRMLLGYLSVWHEHHEGIVTMFLRNPPSKYVRVGIFLMGMLVISWVSAVFVALAWSFSGELAQALK
jgi:hypothetical protein